MKFLHDLFFPTHARQLVRQTALTKSYCKRLNKKKAESHKMVLNMEKLHAQVKDLTKTNNKQHNLIVRYESKLDTLFAKCDTMRTTCGPKSKKKPEPTYLPERIVGMRNNKYCVQWKGYKEHSWEPSTADVIRLNPHLVQAYKSSRKTDR